MSQDALNELTATDATVAAEESAGSQTDAPAMWIGVVSLFPEMFDAITQQGVIGRAVEKQRIALEFWGRHTPPYVNMTHGTYTCPSHNRAHPTQPDATAPFSVSRGFARSAPRSA